MYVADDFWNIRGSFKIGGVVDIGTQASLVRRGNGKFVFLDSYTLSGEVEREVLELTNDGRDVEAILNVHPFHTVFARKMHERFPNAKLYGTERHISRFSGLPWEALRTEDAELHAMFADDFEFSVPRGVDFISANENVHFSSVLVLHRASNTIHVDDTLMYVRLPRLMRVVGRPDAMSFHPTLAKALEKRAGAASDFRGWAEELAERWRDAQNLCAAHTATLTARKNQGPPIQARLLKALAKVERTLATHERKYG
ncbi:MAG: hypothetical protein JRF48_10305 [Deltaproteobacteria bacterium]|nr:hypothetical protein [Deltaproteobacteria bacterium]MBW2214801.1 hypothetical protein [Deltaproteobacteria bacterium]MBW2551674.1 hypothetical protein [Deltaproteobacteria bacterium]